MGIKITKSELQNIIKEEAAKFKKAQELKKELKEIETQLNEVVAGGEMEPGKDGVHAGQKKPVFTSKGNPNLKMEDSAEEEGAEENAIDDGKVEKAEVLNAIDNLKVALGLVPAEGKEDEEIEFDANDLKDETPAEEEAAAEEASSEEESSNEEEEEGAEKEESVMAENKPEEEEEGKKIEENLDEPIEGESVAQVAADSKVDDGMEKDKHVKESVEADKKASIMESERARMAHLAGIIKG
jgi:hypothetical protein